MAVVTAAALGSAAQQQRIQKVTVLVRGVHCFECVDSLRTSLEKMKGIRFDPSAIDTGQKPRFFSEPFVIEIRDPEKTILGAVAHTVSETKTAHRRKFPPSLNLVLYTSDRITEEAVVALRQAVKDVNGLEPMASGGVGGFPNKGFFWLKLEGAGGAVFKDVLKAIEDAGIRVTTEKG